MCIYIERERENNSYYYCTIVNLSQYVYRLYLHITSMAWHGVAWRGVAWRGVAWCGMARRKHRATPRHVTSHYVMSLHFHTSCVFDCFTNKGELQSFDPCDILL